MYSHTDFGSLKSQALDRMGSSFWTDAETGRCVLEALRTWNALTGFHRARGDFKTVSGTAFYSLAAQLPDFLGRTVSHSDVHADAMDRLLEDSSFPYAGTDMFSGSEIKDAFQRRRDRFLIETGCVPVEESLSASSGDSTVDLADDAGSVMRAEFQDPDGDWTVLWREDERTLTAWTSSWSTTSGPPRAWAVLGSPPLTVKLAPAPTDSGTLHLILSESGSPLSVSSSSVLGVPDDFSPALTWGAMSDLLSKDGPARDLERASFCESVYEMFSAAVALSPTVVHAEINGLPLVVDSIFSLDAARNGWRNDSDVPTAVGTLQDLVALSPVPDGVHSILLEVVRKSPVPVLDSEFVQIGREHVGPILDWTCRLMSFKMGGNEFRASEVMAERFLSAAMRQNGRLSASSRFTESVRAQSTSERFGRPYEVGGTGLSSSPPPREDESQTRERRTRNQGF